MEVWLHDAEFAFVTHNEDEAVSAAQLKSLATVSVGDVQPPEFVAAPGRAPGDFCLDTGIRILPEKIARPAAWR